MTVDPDGQIHLAYHSSNDEEADRLYHELKTILNHVGLAQHHVLRKNFYMDMAIGIGGVAHQAGTCRFGSDPATSVLDADCKAHELDNLYVVDTSFFPSIGAVNPALTAMANAIRVGEHLVDRLSCPTCRDRPGTASHPSNRQRSTSQDEPPRQGRHRHRRQQRHRQGASCWRWPRRAPTSSSTT